MSNVAHRLRAIRAAAIDAGDLNLAREAERELARLGIPVEETAVADESLEVAVSPRPRGRPRKG